MFREIFKNDTYFTTKAMKSSLYTIHVLYLATVQVYTLSSHEVLQITQLITVNNKLAYFYVTHKIIGSSNGSH